MNGLFAKLSEILVEEAEEVRREADRRGLLDRFYRLYGKRILDIAFSVVALPVVLPVSALIALAIKLDSPGPVLVRLPRLGRNGFLFLQYKFRSMVENAHETLQELLEAHPELRREFEATQKLKNDPRVTRVGRWLRRTSLDELPQIINVFRGEMSWVGPRAVRPDEITMYGLQGEKLLTVRPGITGLWQVSGRSNLPYQERVRLDMEYIDRMSLGLDLRIMFRTLPVMLKGYGAY